MEQHKDHSFPYYSENGRGDTQSELRNSGWSNQKKIPHQCSK